MQHPCMQFYTVWPCMQCACIHAVLIHPCSVDTSMHCGYRHSLDTSMQCGYIHAVCRLTCSVYASMQCVCIHAVGMHQCSVHASMQCAGFHAMWLHTCGVYVICMIPCSVDASMEGMHPFSVQASMLTYFIKGFQHWLLEIVLYNFLNWQSILVCINTKVKKASVFLGLHNFNPSPIFERYLYDDVLIYSTLEEGAHPCQQISQRNSTLYKCKQLFEYQHLLLLRDIW